MEILNNFNSIYCYIAFIIGAVFVWVIVIIDTIIAIVKDRKSRNNVHFYVTKFGNSLALWFGKPQYKSYGFESNEITVKIMEYKSRFKYFGLNPDDFNDIKEDEIREVFINLED